MSGELPAPRGRWSRSETARAVAAGRARDLTPPRLAPGRALQERPLPSESGRSLSAAQRNHEAFSLPMCARIPTRTAAFRRAAPLDGSDGSRAVGCSKHPRGEGRIFEKCRKLRAFPPPFRLELGFGNRETRQPPEKPAAGWFSEGCQVLLLTDPVARSGFGAGGPVAPLGDPLDRQQRSPWIARLCSSSLPWV